LHPFTLCFYIRFGPHSFNYVVFFLESFIELICLWILSLDILFLYQIWCSFFWLLFLVVLILFLIKIVFQFHPLWFDFFFLLDLVLFLFKSIFFKIIFLICFFMFIPNYFGWFRILHCYFFFVYLVHCDSALWSMWTGFASIISNYF
jgi:hypothetical protein